MEKPRKPRKVEESFMVSLIMFPTLTEREKYRREGYCSLTTRVLFYGHHEQWAAVQFYRACKRIHYDPLVQGVRMDHNLEMVAWIASGIPPAWKFPGLAF